MKLKVNVFVPCYVHQLYPELGTKMVEFFSKLGYSIFISTKSLCCGQPAFHSGFAEDARKVVINFIQGHRDADYIIIPSSSCVGFLRNYAPSLLDFKNMSYHPSFVDCLNKIHEATEFIYGRVNIKKLNISFPHKIAYHKSCASLRETKSDEISLKILKQIKNIEIVPFEYSETCCGFGVGFADKFPDIAISMGKHKLDVLKKLEIDYVVSNDSSCILHLKMIADKLGYNFKFLNIVEVLTI